MWVNVALLYMRPGFRKLLYVATEYENCVNWPVSKGNSGNSNLELRI